MNFLSVIIRVSGVAYVAGEIVTYNEKTLYSDYCTCDEAKAGNDCDHRLAVDRHFDNERFGVSAATTPVTEQVEQSTGLSVALMPCETARLAIKGQGDTGQQERVTRVLPAATLARGMSSIEASVQARDAAILNAPLNGNSGFSLLRR